MPHEIVQPVDFEIWSPKCYDVVSDIDTSRKSESLKWEIIYRQHESNQTVENLD